MPVSVHSTTPIRGGMTIRDAMARYPETYHVFHRFRMDGPWEAACTIEAVTAARGQDLAAFLEALNGAVRTARHSPPGEEPGRRGS